MICGHIEECITTDKSENRHLYSNKKVGLSYYYSGNNKTLSEWDSLKFREDSWVKEIEAWKNTEIVKVELNCEKWIIRFWKSIYIQITKKEREMFLGELNMKPNKTYYPAIAMRGEDKRLRARISLRHFITLYFPWCY